jgi:transposase InsO family protein
MFCQQMKLYMEGQAHYVHDDDIANDDEVDAIKDKDNSYYDHPEESGFMISDELNINVDSPGDNKSTLIFDSGATKTTVCNFQLLIDPTPVTKAMNTYSGQINITHIGKMNLGGTVIHPVYYASNGPRNLISLSQLEDHGLSIYFKSCLVLIRKGATIAFCFPRVRNLYMGQIFEIKTENWIMAVTKPRPDTDYHITLGHPSDEYLRQFLKIHNITPTNPNQLARNCDICQSCKLKRTPHSNPLPTTDRPFKTLHIDVLQITPPSKTKFKYVLVIIDDFSRFNRIYLLHHKNESESRILSYLLEIVNKTGKSPALIHTDRGGEFNSNQFCNKLLELGSNIEVGPANSPQTNGLAERFNQTLFVKIRCSLAQSSVPINFWDEAAKYSSSLINILPSKALKWSSPVSILSKLDMCIEPVRDVHRLIPFGLKVHVHHFPPSKISPTTRPLICLGYENHSNALRFFDPSKRSIVISRDYKPSILNFAYNSSSSVLKPHDSLPTSISPSLPIPDAVASIQLKTPTIRPPSNDDRQIATNARVASKSVSPPRANPQSSLEPQPSPVSPTRVEPQSPPPSVPSLPPPGDRRHAYVPASQPPPKEIRGEVSDANILQTTRHPHSKRNVLTEPPAQLDHLYCLEFDDPDDELLLNKTVSVKDALNHSMELTGWRDAMTKEYNSLHANHTGTLVPPPGDVMVIGGM